MWRKKIINVIMLASGFSEGILVYSYFPYQPRICGEPYPVLVANISEENPHIEVDLFPERLGDLFGCPLKAGIYLIKPFTIDVDQNGKREFTGIEVSVMETVAQQHNFTLNYILPPDGLKWGVIQGKNSTGLMRLIQEELVDFGFGSMTITPERSLYLKSGTPHYTSLVIVAVPSGRSYTTFEKLHKPFSWKAWCLLIFVYVVAAIAIKIFFGPQDIKALRMFHVETYSTPILNTWVSFLGIPVPKMPKKNITNLILVTWMFYGLLIRTAYLAALFKNSHSGDRIRSVQTLEEIELAGLHYYMYSQSQKFFTQLPKISKMSKQIADDDDIEIKMNQLLSGKLDGVLVLPSATVNYFNQHNDAHGYVDIAKDVVATYSVCIYYPKNTPYSKIFDNVVKNLQTSGILNYWREIFGENSHKRTFQGSPMPIDLKSISGVFMIWAVLMGMCCIVFLIECVWGRYWKSK